MARAQMASLHIEHLTDRLFNRVSAGEQRQVLLARALVKKPELLVLDEPCQGLDHDLRYGFMQQLDQRCSEAPIRMIMTTHCMEDIPRTITHVLRLSDGRIEKKGTWQAVLGW